MVYISYLIYAQNIDCGYSLEPPRRGGSNEYPQSIFEQKYEKISNFLSKNFQLLVVKFSIYLNRGVFVMKKCQDIMVKSQQPTCKQRRTVTEELLYNCKTTTRA